MQASTYLKCGDIVQVLTGRSKGKTGKVLRINHAKARVFVERLNLVKRHTKPTQKKPQGGVVEKEASLHWSNVLLVCEPCAKPVRVRRTRTAEGARQRACVKCGKVIGH